jgi:rod shape determining protein RodA
MAGTALAPATGLAPSTRRRAEVGPLHHVDVVLVLLPVAIAALGMLMIYSSTRTRLASQGISTLYYVQRQGLAFGLGLLAMVLVMAVDYRRVRDLYPLVYLVALPLLAGVLLLGASRRGAQAWFQVGPLQFQPSELAKVAVVVVVAGYLHQHRGDLDAWRLAVTLALAGAVVTLVLLQNDLGTALVCVGAVGAMLVVAGIRPVHLAVLALLAGTAIAGAAASGYFEGYRLDRVTSFLDQQEATRESSPAEWNLEQSKTAIGAGGVTGAGLFNGTQTKLSYVPEQHTDFIFTVVGEELGFVGGATILALYGLLVWRMWRTALLSSDTFGTLVCIGVLALTTFAVFENVGMTMGIMPITGIPLPFMSYGGSALIAAFAGIGLVANVHMRRFS